MRYNIYDSSKNLVNTITSSEAFCEKYCNQNGYTYSSAEIDEEDVQFTAQDDTDAMLVDLEYRLTLLELGVTE